MHARSEDLRPHVRRPDVRRVAHGGEDSGGRRSTRPSWRSISRSPAAKQRRPRPSPRHTSSSRAVPAARCSPRLSACTPRFRIPTSAWARRGRNRGMIAVDRRQARQLMNYVGGLIDDSPVIAAEVAEQTRETITFAHRVQLEVHTGSFRSHPRLQLRGGDPGRAGLSCGTSSARRLTSNWCARCGPDLRTSAADSSDYRARTAAAGICTQCGAALRQAL